jgi:hypothetical protein
MPCTSTRTAASWASRWRAPGRVVRDRSALGRLDDLVELALRALKRPSAGKGARHVAGVAVEFAAGVDQAQVAGLQLGIGCRVVQHAGVRAGRDDRAVGRTLRAVAAELVQQLGLDLVFAHAAAGVAAEALRAEAHRAPMRAGRDRGGAAHRRQLAGVLHEPHLAEQRIQVVLRRRRAHAHPRLARSVASQPSTRACSRAGRPAARLPAGSRALDGDLVERLERERFVDAEALRRRGAAEADAVPDLALGVLLAADEGRAAVAPDQQPRPGLVEAGQVVEVAVVAVRMVVVGVALAFRCGRQDRDAAAGAAQLVREAAGAVRGRR